MENFPINIEVIRDISFFEITKTKAMARLYNYATGKNIHVWFYVNRGEERTTKWWSFSGWRVILILFDPADKKVIPANTWLQKNYLAHEIAHIGLRGGEGCKNCLRRDRAKRKYFSSLYHELRAWILGWEILRLLGIAILSEEKKYKATASRILLTQCAECLDVLREKTGRCPYEIQIRNLVKAQKFDLDI